MKYFKKFVTIALIASLSTAFVSCTAETAKEVDITSVRTIEANTGYIDKTLAYTVQFQSNVSENIISPLVAKVEKAYFEVGDYVKAGDVLFELDKESIEDQLSQVEQQVKLAEIGLKNAEIAQNSVTGGSYESQILQVKTNITSLESQLKTATESLKVAESNYANAQETVNIAQASYDLLQKEHERSSILFENGLKSKVEMDQLDIQLQASKSDLSRANTGLLQAESSKLQAEEGIKNLEQSIATTKESLNLTEGKITNENLSRANLGVEQAKSSLESAKLQYDMVKKNIDDASVTASIDGVVNMKGVKEGEYISNSALAYQILDKSKIYADVKVTDRVVNNAKVGDTVNVEFSSKKGEVLQGVIETVSPFVDQTNTYTVKISLDNSDESILLGSFAKVTFVIEDNDTSITLPRKVVLKDEIGNYVYVLEDNVAVKKPVTTGIDNGETIEIIDGIKVGDVVVSEGQSYLYDGEVVNVVE